MLKEKKIVEGILFLMRVPTIFKNAIFEKNDTLFTYPPYEDKESRTLRSLHF